MRGVSGLSLLSSRPIIHFSPAQVLLGIFSSLSLHGNCLLSGILSTMNETGKSDRTNDMPCWWGMLGKGLLHC